MPSRESLFTVLGILAVACLIAFGASLGHGFSMLDDPYLVVSNVFAHGPTLENIRHVFTHYDPELYIPLTMVSYQLNYLIVGLDAGLYHATNILLHILNASLVVWLCSLLTGRKWTSLFAGLLFALHPLNTEAVVWVAGRKDLLSTLFFLGSLIAYVQYRSRLGVAPQGEAGSLDSKKMYWLSVVLFLPALLAKASVMTLPLVLLISDFAFEHRKFEKKMVTDKLPHLALAVIFGIVAWLGKGRVVHASSIWETALMAGKSTVFYLQKLLVPTGLNPIYPYHDPITISSPDFLVPLAILLVLTMIILATLKKTRVVFAAAAFFLITLAPSFLNFHKGAVRFFAVDRYAYIPMIALLMLFAAGITIAHERFYHPLLRRSLPFLCVILFGAAGATSAHQTSYWSDDEKLLSHSLDLYPDSIPSRISMSVIFRETGRQDLERAILEQGIRFRDDHSYRIGLGSILARENKLDEAEAEYEKAKVLDRENPEPYFYLGSLEEQRGKTDEALKNYAEAIRLDESYAAAYTNAGAIYMDRGDYTNAETMFAKAIEWNPSFLEGLYNYYQLLAMTDRKEEGFPYLVRAYHLNPDIPEIGLALGYTYYEEGNYDRAEEVVAHVVEVSPDDRTAIRLLALIRQERDK